MNLNTFNQQIQNVIDWNAVARGLKHSFEAADINNQTAYTHEEIKETIAGLATNNAIETLDGAADIFVTLAYKYFLMRGEFNGDFTPEVLTCEELTDPAFRDDYLIYAASTLLTNNLYAESVADIQYTMELLYFMLNTIEEWYGVDMHAVISEVMRSNWSKFPVQDETVNYRHMCHEIEVLRKRENISYDIVSIGGENRVSFRDNGGAGKIMKPPMFVHPNIASLL